MIDQDAAEDMPYKGIEWIDNKTILTPTGGFLAAGFTHTLNPYVGCAFAKTPCGIYCYAQHQHWITKGRPWGLYGAKRNVRQAYQEDYDRLKHPHRGEPKPLRIFMSSSTDPYVPHEQKLQLTRAVLEEMQARPPDVLVLQTHTTLVQRDFDLIRSLADRCELWLSITVETDMEHVPGFPPHASSPAKRLETLKLFRDAGVPTQATISPLMPLANPQTFAQALDAACDRVIVDHFLIGDGTHGARTKRTDLIRLLEQAGFSEWTRIEKLWEIRDMLASVLGEHRVLVSAEGFNAVGANRQPTAATPENAQPIGGNLMSTHPIAVDVPTDLRERAMRAAKWLNASETWRPLALVLAEIKEKKAYRAWHFSSLAAFAEQELDLSKSVVSELLRSHQYLAHRHPEYLGPESSAAELPSYSTIAILARNVAKLPEEMIETLDTALFAGTIKRPALKEAIRKALPQQPAAEPQQEPSEPIGVLQTLLETLDVAALREQITTIFDSWEEAPITDRHQLFSRLIALLDQLQVIKQTIS